MVKRGRKSKFTPAVVQEITDGIADGLTEHDAALAAGIGPSTHHQWKKEKPEYPEVIGQARARRTRRWLTKLGERAERGDVRSIEALLDRCAPEYRKTSNVQVSTAWSESEPARKDYSRLTLEELEAIAAIEQRALDRLRGEASAPSLGPSAPGERRL